MVRKTVFDRADIINAAYEVVKTEGWGQLTARRMADELGASTAPVYSNFANMEELENAAADLAVVRILEFTTRKWTENAFLNMGLGILEFVRECPRWYQALFLGSQHDNGRANRLMAKILEDMAAIPELSALPALERTILLHKVALFTHGLATDICSSCPDCHSREEIRVILGEVWDALVKDALERPPRPAAEKALMTSFTDLSNLNLEEDLP